MFQLSNFTRVVLGSLNVRSEMHGTAPVPAVDLKFELTSANHLLDEIDDQLKPMLYMAGDEGDEDQPELDGVEPITDMPFLRCADLEPVQFKKEYAGYSLVIDHGLGGDSNVSIGLCEVNKMVFEPLEGGSLKTTFRVQASNISADVIGKLGVLVKHEVQITLLPPMLTEAIDASSSTGDWPFGTNGDGNRPNDGADSEGGETDATDAFLAAQADA